MKLRNEVLIATTLLALTACGGSNQGGSSTQAPTSSSSNAAPTAAAPTGTANVSGSVKFTGAKPAVKKIQMTADAYCKTQHPGGSVDAQDVVVNANGTLANVYVYVKGGLNGKTFPAPTTPAVFDQHGCMYSPHVLAVQTGQEIVVRNSDGVLHNINARPKINKGFNFGQPVQGMESKKSFDKPEVMIPVKCDVHPWMSGWIGVQDHPFAGVTGDDGSFSLKGLPAGTYTIEAWHEKYGTSDQTVTVGDNETKSITFTFKG